MKGDSRPLTRAAHLALAAVVSVGGAFALWPTFAIVAILTQHSTGSFFNTHWHVLSPVILAVSLVLLGIGAVVAFARRARVVAAAAMIGVAYSALWRALAPLDVSTLLVLEFLVALACMNGLYLWQTLRLRAMRARPKRRREVTAWVLLAAQALVNIVLLIGAAAGPSPEALAAGALGILCVMPLPSILLKPSAPAKAGSRPTSGSPPTIPGLFYPAKPETFDAMSDSELVNYVDAASNEFRYQAEFYLRIHENYSLSPEQVESWQGPGIKLLDAVTIVIAEVCNGGFRQYFDNSSGDSAELAIRGYREIGIPEVAEVIEQAKEAVFGDGWDDKFDDQDLRQEHLDKLGDGVREILDPFDQRIYEIQDGLGGEWLARLAAYIRRHPEDFFRPSSDLPEYFHWMKGRGY